MSTHDWCTCREGPYFGAQMAGTPLRCERCGREEGGAEVVALATEIQAEVPSLPFGRPEQLAHVVITSDWLADRLADAWSEGLRTGENFEAARWVGVPRPALRAKNPYRDA